jgi:acyl-CoA synthetase (AMP-forming)/AMP-acid ligase II
MLPRCEPKDSGDGSVDPKSPFTLLYTSGSTGQPKGIVATVSSFVSGISESSFATPLVTSSYIPLSHSSDRLKLWTWLVSGGRVGFLHYAASNWAAHESGAKKDGASTVASEQSLNDVPSLLQQAAWLAPTHMSMPPRVWSGARSLALAIDALAGPYLPSHRQQDASSLGCRSVAAALGPRLDTAITGGAITAPAARAFAKHVCAAAGAGFSESYGSSEAGGITQDGIPMVQSRSRVEVRLCPVEALGLRGDGATWWKAPRIDAAAAAAASKKWLNDGAVSDRDMAEMPAPEAQTGVGSREGEEGGAHQTAETDSAGLVPDGMTRKEGGTEVLGATGALGEICVRGADVCGGYWRNREASTKAFVDPDGSGVWWRSGDLGVRLRAGPSSAAERYEVLGRLAGAETCSGGSQLVLPGLLEAALEAQAGVLGAVVSASPAHSTVAVLLSVADEASGGTVARVWEVMERLGAVLEDTPDSRSDASGEGEHLPLGCRRVVAHKADSKNGLRWALPLGCVFGPVGTSPIAWSASNGLRSGEGKTRRRAVQTHHEKQLAELHQHGDKLALR